MGPSPPVTSVPASYQRQTSTLVVVSTMTTAITLFAVFHFTAELLSAEWIGAWSLIQGLFLVARVSDSGAGNNISRVIAVRAKHGAHLDIKNTTIASVAIACIPSMALAVITAPFIGLYVAGRFGEELGQNQLWSLVWLALLNAAFAALSNVLFAICEGVFQLNYRSSAVIAANVVGLIALVPLLKVAGPAGVGWVYVIIFGVQLIFAALRVVQLARSELPAQSLSICQHIRLLWRENLHLSGIALLRLSFEPTTKFFLSLFAPLIIIAQFELALRVTTQVRTLVQSALQSLLVLGARPNVNDSSTIREVFIKNDRVLYSLSVGGLIAQILAAPAIQWLGMGSHERIFVVFFAFLAVGNAVNTMGLSGYYWQLSSGSLSPLVRIQAVMAVANICIGALGRALESTVVVVAAYSAALVLGGLTTRSFLRDVPRFTRAISPCLVIVGGFMTSGVVLLLRPASLTTIGILLGIGTAVGSMAVYFAFRKARRRSS